MASTNHTANYSLSQFAQTDKPAWLGDYNQDMNKIDTGMKANADDIDTLETTVSGHTTAIAGNTSDIATLESSVSGISGDISTLQSDVSGLSGDVDTLESTVETHTGQLSTQAGDISTLQSRVTTDEGTIASNTSAIGTNTSDINTLNTKVTNLVNKFNLNNITTQKISQLLPNMGYVSQTDVITLAQNSDGSLFKMYGCLTYYNDTASTKTLSKTAVAGLSGYYGIKTTLHLKTAPTSAYSVSPFEIVRGPSADVANIWSTAFAVGTDGYIYLYVSTDSSISTPAYTQEAIWYHPEGLYFNTNFGDIPTPPQA